MFILERNDGALLLGNHADALYVAASAATMILKVKQQILLRQPRDVVHLDGTQAWNALDGNHRSMERVTCNDSPNLFVIYRVQIESIPGTYIYLEIMLVKHELNT